MRILIYVSIICLAAQLQPRAQECASVVSFSVDSSSLHTLDSLGWGPQSLLQNPIHLPKLARLFSSRGVSFKRICISPLPGFTGAHKVKLTDNQDTLNSETWYLQKLTENSIFGQTQCDEVSCNTFTFGKEDSIGWKPNNNPQLGWVFIGPTKQVSPHTDSVGLKVWSNYQWSLVNTQQVYFADSLSEYIDKFILQINADSVDGPANASSSSIVSYLSKNEIWYLDVLGRPILFWSKSKIPSVPWTGLVINGNYTEE